MGRIDKGGAGSGGGELGADGIVVARQGSDALRGRNPPASISLDGAGFMPAAVPPARAGGARSGAALCRQNDRAEPGAGHALNRVLPALRASTELSTGRVKRSGPRHGESYNGTS